MTFEPVDIVGSKRVVHGLSMVFPRQYIGALNGSGSGENLNAGLKWIQTRLTKLNYKDKKNFLL